MSVFIVAEAGVNHLGDRSKMLALCDAAKQAGADAVKFQAYDTYTLGKRRGYLIEGTDSIKPEFEDTWRLLQESQLTDADLDAIAAHCKVIGLKWFASVFDPSQVERVVSRGACAAKIGHAEWDWWELYKACHGAFGSHRIWVSRQNVSTMSADSGPAWLHGARCNVLCVGKYPADGHPPHLGWIQDHSINGFSSHYTDYRIPAAAALRGAEYIEAHLKLSDTDPEAAWSLSPEDFGKMVKLIREYESWL